MKKRSFALLFLFISVAPFARPLHSQMPPVHAGYRQPTVADTAEIPDEHIREPMTRDKF
ncbi:hypothetical protein GCM10009414_07450 [Tatumella terrea]|uniref:hypothetical protein n=1 Tax=Tatumella TaxID=82986 RepID=UPI001BAE792F|nr:hypothetical protein [Tatumella sp. JGM118]MBS0908094.1 hypothetical protein [Tatumella sp. JGM118]